MRSEGPKTHRVLLGGGIGAGKSTVAAVFVAAGYRLIEADKVGAQVLGPGTIATAAVANTWPGVMRNGEVDRGALARIVFADPVALEMLESITHPEIVSRIQAEAAVVRGNIVVETPLAHLVLEGDWLRVAIIADTETRIARAVVRGGDPVDVRRRVEAQLTNDEWARWADIVVANNGSWSETEQSISAIIEGAGE